MSADPEVPLWLNTEFFQTLLRENETDPNLVVDNVDVGLAVAKGENFASFLHRADVTITKGGKIEHRYLMVKSLPEGGAILAFLQEGQIFQKETRVYHEILPAFRRLQESSGAAVTSLGCKCYQTSRPHTIVMEDLTRRGYKVADRLLGLDLDHCKLAMTALATFHALSLALLKNDPNFKDKFRSNFFIPEKRIESHYQQDRNVAALAKEVGTWKGYEEYGEKLLRCNLLDKVIDLLQVESKFSVLCHGDTWLNNMMFKYSDEGSVEEVQFVDFQLCRHLSLAYDIHYFMHSSATEEVRTKHWDLLIEKYHSVFEATLKSIDFITPSVFTLEELKKELDDKYLFALLTAFLVLPVILASPGKAPELSKIPEYDPDKKPGENEGDKVSYLAASYAGSRFKEVLQSLLPKFHSAGIL